MCTEAQKFASHKSQKSFDNKFNEWNEVLTYY